ncbi:MAG TPA: DUF2141 domain-containing protein [Caulobacteraceae bacterium]
MAAWALATMAAAAPVRSVETMPCHGAPTPYRLMITVQGLRNNHGHLVTNLYGADRRRWLADKGWITVQYDQAIPGDETVCVYLPAPGQYALVMFHDSNDDQALDLGPLGPAEGYGFSNNVRPFLSAPSLKSALFATAGRETHVTIRLHYPPLS